MTKTSDTAVPLRKRGHPLELIALFRRWPPSLLRNLVYTAIWNCMVALVLSALHYVFGKGTLAYEEVLFRSLVGANLVGYLIHGTLHVFERVMPASANRWLVRVLELALIGMCAVLGIAIATGILRGVNPLTLFQAHADLSLLLAIGLITAAIMIVVLVLSERRVERETQAARQQEQFATAARMLAEARLRTLQAQIEPHFLYNTLANVLSLIDTRPAQAKQMLERFIDYLRASLAASRSGATTLGLELETISAYLDVLKVRMGQRLRYRIEAGDDCRALPIAPMLLQPLVENAVMHGIEPKVEGGDITVRARVADGMLRLEVSDTGRGLTQASPRPGGGVGLSNLRERVRQLHGPAARLELLENPEGGVTSRLLLPLPPNQDEVPPSPPFAP